MKDESLEKFKDDVARFSGNYLEFLIIVKKKDGGLTWKFSDKAWALGAVQRYWWCMEEWDREDERRAIDKEGENG